MWPSGKKCLAISGGVGGAKLALGLANVLSAAELAIVTNTADDFVHLGLNISPDLDTVMYTLAYLNNKELGWGLADESWNFLEALRRLNGDSWFRLGDRDLATHILRTEMLKDGQTLSEVTAYLCHQLGVEHPMFPMTDDPVSTEVLLREGDALLFQHYFVRERCEPAVTGFRFRGVEKATMSGPLQSALADPELALVVICPSNPFVSIDPLLSIPGVREALRKLPVIAVSPIVGGQALKGPTAKMMKELGMPESAAAVASHYGDILSGYILDVQDESLIAEVEAMGLATTVTATVMVTLEDRIQLARDTLDLAAQMG